MTDKILFVHNFRYGFATNSSSSHSVVIIPDRAIADADTWDGQEYSFNWENFVLSTPESKIAYLTANLINGSYDSTRLGDNAASMRVAKIISEESGFDVTGAIEDKTSYDVSVDHQSRLGFPESSDPELIKALVHYFKNPRIVVYGGNDNSDGMEHQTGSVDSPLARLADSSGKIVARKDNGYFVMFSPYDGTKIRISLEDDNVDLKDIIATKAFAPELVDLKITDFCSAGCSFCYMGSTKEGKHAPLERIEAILDILAEMKVFEVALGGGEPTTHPQFVEILRAVRARNMVPNFTTFTDDWLSHPQLKDIKELTGAVGVSCMSSKDIPRAVAIKKAGFRVMAQHVVGSVPPIVTFNFIRDAADQWMNILLLGFKEVGFGKDYTRHDSDPQSYITELALVMDKLRDRITMSVDTALVDRFPTLTTLLGVPEATVTSPEGKFSCYVDGVRNRMGMSSYVEDDKMVDMPVDTAGFLSVFKTY